LRKPGDFTKEDAMAIIKWFEDRVLDSEVGQKLFFLVKKKMNLSQF
jgi:hypothetical protein